VENLDSSEIGRPHPGEMHKNHKSEQRNVGEDADRKAANHHQRMGKLPCNIDRKIDNTGFRHVSARAAWDVLLEDEDVEEADKTGKRTIEAGHLERNSG